MIKMIAAVSINGVIGVNNDIPWMGKYPDDMAFFRAMTKDSIVVMGRKTFESMGNRPLPKRENRIVSASMNVSPPKSDGVCIWHPTLKEAVDAPQGTYKDIWLIGGEGIYTEGLQYADEIYTTLIPERVDIAGKTCARFPYVHPLEFDCEKRMMSELVPAADKQKLVVAIYRPSKTVWH